MIKRLTKIFPSFLTSVLNSYSQVFLSDRRLFAILLVVVTFFDPYAGLSGLLAVVISNILAYITGFNRDHIKRGFYGFNSLLVGLGLGVLYQPSPAFYSILFFVSILTLLITITMEGVIGKYGLPFLSIPFLLSIWFVTLASRQFAALQVSERGIYMMNEMYSMGGTSFVRYYNWFNEIPLPESFRIYFKSLGAIFFQYHLLPGLIVAVGLLLYSRIAFILSLIGFFSAYGYYHIIGANIEELSYGYIGFNYILTSIAIGGFFMIPSRYSYLWVILLTPVIAILLTATNSVFIHLQLSVYSLPFNMVVLMFLYGMKFRERFYKKPELVSYQQFSPEKNLYSHLNYESRFGKARFVLLELPVFGVWKITQGHNGMHTHQGEWKHAFDFELTDKNDKTFSGSGDKPEDYFAYNKPVIAPADGVIEEVVDNIEDNRIGRLDIEHNWGNTIVIRHHDRLFTKLSHLKPGTIKVKKGDAVKKGQVLASCGNSGRSPVPHLHFQVQADPYIGSKTLDYPFSHYILHTHDRFELGSFDVPETGSMVSNIAKNTSLEKAFAFVPGQKIRFHVEGGKKGESLTGWEVHADYLNNTFISCERSGSKAWFRNDGKILYFTHFEGDRNSLLYYFFLGAYKVLMGYYKDILIEDIYPVNLVTNRWFIYPQDFFAPFRLFLNAKYEMRYGAMDDELLQTNITLSAAGRIFAGRRIRTLVRFTFLIDQSGLSTFTVSDNTKTITATILHED